VDRVFKLKSDKYYQPSNMKERRDKKTEEMKDEEARCEEE